MSNSNTGHKYISRTNKDWFVVSIPASQNRTERSISRRQLSGAIAERNRVLGYDPDQPTADNGYLPVVHTQLAPEMGQRLVFGALGDTHLGSKYQRLDALQAYYTELKQRGVKTVFHTGNYIEGEASFNTHDVMVHGFENQLDHFIQHYPMIDGMTTYFVDGDDHEGWYTKREGIEVGQRLEEAAVRAGRNDLRYLGYMEADVSIEVSGAKLLVRILHGGGGSSRAVSLAAQNIIDSYAQSELPHILLIGHYHKSHFLPNYRGVNAIQTGTFQEQTPFMRKKKLIAALGGFAVSVTVPSNGRPRIGAEYLHYDPLAWKYQLRQEVITVEV